MNEKRKRARGKKIREKKELRKVTKKERNGENVSLFFEIWKLKEGVWYDIWWLK